MILDKSNLENIYVTNLYQIPNYLRTGYFFKDIEFSKHKEHKFNL